MGNSAQQAQNGLKFLSDLGRNILALAAFFTVVGFVAHTIHIYRVASIIRYTAYPHIYLFWGVIIVLAVVIRLSIITFPILLFLVLAPHAFNYLKWKRLAQFIEKIGDRTASIIIKSVMFWFFIIAFVFYSAIFPETVMPFSIGNSVTPNLIVIFKENLNPQIWHLPTNPASPQTTLTLILVEEYNDGILVKDPLTQAVVFIKNDVIAGFINSNSIATTIPTPVLTPTP